MSKPYTLRIVIFVLYSPSRIIAFASFRALVSIIFSIVVIDFIFFVFSRLFFDVGPSRFLFLCLFLSLCFVVAVTCDVVGLPFFRRRGNRVDRLSLSLYFFWWCFDCKGSELALFCLLPLLPFFSLLSGACSVRWHHFLKSLCDFGSWLRPPSKSFSASYF